MLQPLSKTEAGERYTDVTARRVLAITLDRYSHPLPTLQARAMARLDTVLGRRRDAGQRGADAAGAGGSVPDKGPNRRAAGTEEPDPSVDRAQSGESGTAYRIPSETSHAPHPRSPSTSKGNMRRMRQDP
jgi:hypothetical protein